MKPSVYSSDGFFIFKQMDLFTVKIKTTTEFGTDIRTYANCTLRVRSDGSGAEFMTRVYNYKSNHEIGNVYRSETPMTLKDRVSGNVDTVFEIISFAYQPDWIYE